MKITDEQIRSSQEWELRLAEGKCNLNEALYMCMASGAPISKYMLERYDQAINEYVQGKYDDLAEPFGIEMTQHSKKAMKKIDSQRKVIDLVDLFSEQGFSKTNPNSYSDTAFHKAAEVLNKSPSHIYDLYGEGKKDMKLSKADTDKL